ncbi:MAG: phytanoyl-CoA dioxygenase family protein [Candidatus Latescibacteria bacterium]|nr:phytanoyl-CoA dioxygenase family protein [Candidatus Latescibacterota bacterium]
MGAPPLSAEQLRQFDQDGYLILEDYFPRADMELLSRIARADQQLAAIAVDRRDADGRVGRLSLRYELPEDVYSALVHSRRIVEPLEQLLRAEVYHYHHKMMIKEPFGGGAWEWHQDFGYWYSGFHYPDMASCMIALDRATRQNGCLQVIRGSHRLGRIDHGKVADQTGADPQRVELVLQRLDKVYCELSPGSALFFHSNLLHRSDANNSPDPRWALICCYNTVHNPPFRPEVKGQYERLERWDDAQVHAMAEKHWQEVSQGQAATHP